MLLKNNLIKGINLFQRIIFKYERIPIFNDLVVIFKQNIIVYYYIDFENMLFAVNISNFF